MDTMEQSDIEKDKMMKEKEEMMKEKTVAFRLESKSERD